MSIRWTKQRTSMFFKGEQEASKANVFYNEDTKTKETWRCHWHWRCLGILTLMKRSGPIFWNFFHYLDPSSAQVTGTRKQDKAPRGPMNKSKVVSQISNAIGKHTAGLSNEVLSKLSARSKHRPKDNVAQLEEVCNYVILYNTHTYYSIDIHFSMFNS